MKFFGHFLLSLLILPLYYEIGNWVFLIMLASVAIDLDHLQIFIRDGAYTPSKIAKTYGDFMKVYHKDPHKLYEKYFYLCHTLEFNLLLLALCFIYPVLIYVSIGFIYHIFWDSVHHYYYDYPLHKHLFLTMNFI